MGVCHYTCSNGLCTARCERSADHGGFCCCDAHSEPPHGPRNSPVPGHINTVTGRFCTREGLVTPGGKCPDGCDHAAHYTNDGHPECEG